MKELNQYIKEGLKVNSKSKIKDIDFKTFKDFVDVYKDEMTYFSVTTFYVNKGVELYDKLNNFFELNLSNDINYNEFIKNTKKYNTDRYHLYISDSDYENNITISCFTKTYVEINKLKIYMVNGSKKQIIVTIKDVSNKESEELLMNGFKYIFNNV